MQETISMLRILLLRKGNLRSSPADDTFGFIMSQQHPLRSSAAFFHRHTSFVMNGQQFAFLFDGIKLAAAGCGDIFGKPDTVGRLVKDVNVIVHSGGIEFVDH